MGLLIAPALAATWQRTVAASLAWLIAFGTLGSAPAQAQETPNIPAGAALPSEADLEARLRVACEQRMRHLQAVQQDNLASMRWQRDAIGMRGEYVGYAPDYECTLSTAARAVPIGRMRYREIRFEKRGEDTADAMRADPAPLGIEDVTQVFVYRDGLWQ